MGKIRSWLRRLLKAKLPAQSIYLVLMLWLFASVIHAEFQPSSSTWGRIAWTALSLLMVQVIIMIYNTLHDAQQLERRVQHIVKTEEKMRAILAQASVGKHADPRFVNRN